MKRLGIIGGGQLGMMLAQAAEKIGVAVTFLDPNPKPPAASTKAKHIQAAFDDADAIRQLAKEVDAVTYEFEHIDAEALATGTENSIVHPSISVLKTIQDKLLQKQFLEGRGLPLGDFTAIKSQEDAQKLLNTNGAIILKSRANSYDGKGNWVVRSESDLTQAYENFGNAKLFAESLLDFEAELSVIVARAASGEEQSFPVVQTVHVNNICHEVFSPGDFDTKILKKAEQVAREAIDALQGVGVFAVELFLVNGEILINEVAPRVHNSGHHTIEQFDHSQFELHVRCVLGLDLPQPKALFATATMINVLGNGSKQVFEATASGELEPNIFWHNYHKIENVDGRKMGHITVVGDTLEATKQRAEIVHERMVQNAS